MASSNDEAHRQNNGGNRESAGMRWVEANPLLTHRLSRNYILIPMAEEMITAAHRLLPSLIKTGKSDEYFRLVTTAINSFDSVARDTAVVGPVDLNIRYRLAELLFLETRNYGEAEAWISRALSSAPAMTFYSPELHALQLLQLRIMSKSNPRAAHRLFSSYYASLKHNSQFNEKMPTYLYTAVLLECEMYSGLDDYHMAISRLNEVFSTCIVPELVIIWRLQSALFYLFSGNVQSASQCIDEAARITSPEIAKQYPQLVMMHHIYSLCASLFMADWKSVTARMSDLHNLIDSQKQTADKKNWVGWSLDGVIELSIQGVHVLPSNPPLKISWMTRHDILILSCLLSGISCFYEPTRKKRALRYLDEGIRMTDVEIFRGLREDSSLSLVSVLSRAETLQYIRCVLHCFSLLDRISRGEWKKMDKKLSSLVDLVCYQSSLRARRLGSFVLYLFAMFCQSQGDLQRALHAYELIRQLPDSPQEIKILSSIACILILRGPNLRDESKAAEIEHNIKQVCLSNESKQIQAAWVLVLLTEGQSAVDSRALYPTFLDLAKGCANVRFLNIALYIFAKESVIPEQKEQLSRAAFINSKQSNDLLWAWLSGMIAERTLQLNNKPALLQKQVEINTEIRSKLEATLQGRPITSETAESND